MIKKLIGQLKTPLMIYAAIAVIGIAGSTYIKGRIDGVNVCERASEKAVKKETKRQGKAADALKQTENQNDAKITKRIIYIKQKIKPGSCMATDAPDDVINSLGGLLKPSSNIRKRSAPG